MLRKKNITLNGRKAEGKESLKQGDIVKIFLADETYEKFGGRLLSTKISVDVTPYVKAYETLKDIEIIYEDEHVLIVNYSGIDIQKLPEAISRMERIFLS